MEGLEGLEAFLFGVEALLGAQLIAARGVAWACSPRFMWSPALNDAFQHCQTGNPSEYSQIEETLSPEVLQIIGDWILQHVHPSP